jgi:hypothetical protein
MKQSTHVEEGKHDHLIHGDPFFIIAAMLNSENTSSQTRAEGKTRPLAQ